MKKILSLCILLNITIIYAQSPVDNFGFINDWRPIKEINTKYHEFSMTISPDGSFMIFGSTRPGGLGDKDLWISYFNEGKWTEPENLKKLNSSFHDQEPFITYDGNALLFSSDRDGGMGVGDIYISYRQGKKWSKPVNIGPPVNTRDSEKMPSVSMDNKELFFSRIPVDYKTRSLKKDHIQIFTSVYENNHWLVPVKLSKPVNQLTYDFASRIMPDNRTLLFCSARKGGKGGFDIWRVSRDKPEAKWNKLSNLSSVNTEKNEVHFAFTISGDRMYMTSQRVDEKNYDIYEYIVKEQIIDPTITLQGRITNKKNGEPIESSITVEMFSDLDEKFNIKSSKKTGEYSVTLPKGGDYSITVESPKFMFYSRRLDLTELSNSFIANVNIGLHPLIAGENIIIRTIYFDPDSHKLRKESRIALNRLVKILKQNPAIRLLIKGHVAKVSASKIDPQWLSKQRAKAVKQYLVENDISPSRLQTKGFGSSNPIGDNSTEEGRIKNRRTEFEILK